MTARAWIVAGGALIALVAATTVALTADHTTGSRGAGTSLAARRLADTLVVPGLRPSSGCVGGSSHCYVDSQSVISSSNAVFEAMQEQTHTRPRLRCFPHLVGAATNASQPNAGAVADSCVVDVVVDGHLAYAYIDPATSGSPAHSVLRGSIVHFAAN